MERSKRSMAIGVIADEEIGQSSETKEVVFAG